MSKYFIYYSATGNGDFLASLFEKANYKIIKVETIKPLGKMNVLKMIKLGGDAMMKKKRKIKPIELELKEDDEVVIGSPIWNDRLSTPINSLLNQFKFNLETTKFVLYPAGSSTKKSLKQIANLGFKLEPLVISNPLKKQEEAIELLNL